MKKFFTLLFYVILIQSTFCIAQPGEWVWMHGPSTLNGSGSFGVQGVSSPTNVPPAFYEACEWTDLNGNFWLFGGLPSGNAAFGDLWKYDPSTNEWTWMKGNGAAGNTGNFGVQGVSSPFNQPPAREHGIITWTDLSNNLWMYGGNSVMGDLSDLWKYDISTNEWTWMKGPTVAYDPGVYGTQGVSSPANNPSSREEAGSAWTDNNGDLWFFGGWIGSGDVNDLWKYNIASNEWTWMKGSPLIAQPGVYGSLRVEDPANVPGSRCAYTHWKDMNGNFWLFGGVDFYANDFNDMWRFNPLTNNWTWMSGSNMQGAVANYGNVCVTDSLNNPGTRYENRMVWTDLSGNLWIFGGNVGSQITDYKNDLWKYCISTNEWTWVEGDSINPVGNWGTMGVSSPLNKPDGRMGCVGWRKQTGEFYLWGGTTTGFGNFHNDMWKYTTDPTCGICSTVPVAMFNAPNHICPGTCIDFTNASQNGTSYLWTFAGAVPSTSIDVNPTSICYNSPGTYAVSLIATNSNGSDTLVLNNFITVYPYPLPQGISQSGDTLFANQGATSYQWYYSGNIIPGATDYYYVATQSGNYNVVATNSDSCEVEAAIFDVVASVEAVSIGSGEIRLYPNPVDGTLMINCQGGVDEKSLGIFNGIGERLLFNKPVVMDAQRASVDVSDFASGIYWIEMQSGSKVFRVKFVKQ